ncbi:hypothetical protein [Bacillus chungangensis]|uniref:Methyl-accepting chemotaxis protein n=1 Tax=Bacillus chungangensis TaxID=587633 RepID=A0ABT9WWS5_9BACI|nr:hypothetical protein [Bacillus chungangensis]MDQ0177631.1 methyl-accepting chemotaxis protein [Bacillus chungangensis]
MTENEMFGELMKELKEMRGEMSQGSQQVDQRFEQVDERFGQVDKRFEQMGGSIQQLGVQITHLTAKVDDLTGLTGSMKVSLDAHNATILIDQNDLKKRVKKNDQRLDRLDKWKNKTFKV